METATRIKHMCMEYRRRVLERRISPDAAIQTAGLPAGLYFLRLKTDADVHFRKVLIR